MKPFLLFGVLGALTLFALGCGSEKGCVTNSDCGGGLNFCDNGTCRTSPGEIVFEGEDPADAEGDTELEAQREE
ncbi:hypothetical protein F9K50_09915 [bacterium]|nr:MAG: hypothetical protein F9K50_09915 [bacterium]